MLYRTLKILIGIGIKLYYKEIKIKNLKNLEQSGPVIIVANHPNTMMDAWILGGISKKRIYFMAKGTFFNTPLKMWFLRGLGLIPINRATESKTKGVSNENSFEMCYRTLEEGKTLVIFPEGNSHLERQLRELKSGTARIALEVGKRNKTIHKIKIIPVGLVYSKAEKFRSSIYVNIGKNIDSTPYLEEYKQNSKKAANDLTEEIRTRLNQLLVGSNSSEHELLIDDIVEILYSRYQKRDEKGVEKNVAQIKETTERINSILVSSPTRMDEIKSLVDQIKLEIGGLDIKSDFLDRSYRPRMFIRQLFQSTLFLVIGLPLFLFGAIHNFIPFKLTDVLISKLVKDMEYYAPMAILFGLVLYPLTFFGFVVLVDYFIPMPFYMKVIYFLLMPLLGMFAFYFLNYIGHISLKANYIFLMNAQKEVINSLQENRLKLRALIFE